MKRTTIGRHYYIEATATGRYLIRETAYGGYPPATLGNYPTHAAARAGLERWHS